MNAVLGFKNLEADDQENCPCGLDLRQNLNGFHEGLMKHVSLVALQDPSEEVSSSNVLQFVYPPHVFTKIKWQQFSQLSCCKRSKLFIKKDKYDFSTCYKIVLL